MTFAPVEEQLLHLKRGTAEIIPEDQLQQKLEISRATDTPLTVKLGCDPSRPDLHLGHAVVLRKLRQFQDLGHHVVFIVGDFTGMIGDPSGRSKTRPALSLEETRRNGQSYYDQACHVLDSERASLLYNSDWLGKLTFEDVIRLASTTTVAQQLAREDFSARYKNDLPIGLNEFLYPLAQAYDSVEIKADIELGGTDQTFNLLMGRTLQKSIGQDPQVCMTMPMLEGLDGAEKMSKSLDNYVGITESASTMYGKLLSIPDKLIYRYFELASDVDTRRLPELAEQWRASPRDAKHLLAFTIAQMYHGREAAQEARAHFERTVIKKEVPDNLEDFRPEADGQIGLLSLLTQAGLTASNGAARRLVMQGAVRINGDRVSDSRRVIDLPRETPFVVKVGKRRFARIVW